MSTTMAADPGQATGAEHVSTEQQFATFYLGDLLLGVDIRQVQEINRQLHVTRVPHAPETVHGVINLRGDVATVINLRTILDLPSAKVTRDSRTMIVHTQQGESVGFIVDRISDILTLRKDEISPSPANIDGVEGRFFSGVHTLESEIVVLLSIEEVLNERRGRD